MGDNLLYKKKYIEAFVEKIYSNDKINYLFPEPISSFKQYALDMFLDTNLTEEQISENIILLVTERKKLYDENNLLIKREQDIRNVVSKIYIENPGLFTKSLEDMQKDYIELYLNNKSIKIEDIENSIMETVNELKERKNNEVNEGVKPIVLEHKPENISFEEKTVSNDEINTILNEPSNNEKEVISEQKEVTKVKKKNQTGSISLFSIGITILTVTAFILVAMILNVLLK